MNRRPSQGTSPTAPPERLQNTTAKSRHEPDSASRETRTKRPSQGMSPTAPPERRQLLIVIYHAIRLPVSQPCQRKQPDSGRTLVSLAARRAIRASALSCTGRSTWGCNFLFLPACHASSSPPESVCDASPWIVEFSFCLLPPGSKLSLASTVSQVAAGIIMAGAIMSVELLAPLGCPTPPQPSPSSLPSPLILDLLPWGSRGSSSPSKPTNPKGSSSSLPVSKASKASKGSSGSHSGGGLPASMSAAPMGSFSPSCVACAWPFG